VSIAQSAGGPVIGAGASDRAGRVSYSHAVPMEPPTARARRDRDRLIGSRRGQVVPIDQAMRETRWVPASGAPSTITGRSRAICEPTVECARNSIAGAVCVRAGLTTEPRAFTMCAADRSAMHFDRMCETAASASRSAEVRSARPHGGTPVKVRGCAATVTSHQSVRRSQVYRRRRVRPASSQGGRTPVMHCASTQ
jgi:hypothetical protein